MPVEMGMWRIVDGKPVRVHSSVMPSESALEDLLEQDPAILGEKLLVIGRQVHTAQGKVVDLLAIDGDGALHVLELKRDKTPRDVVAQILDYGSWAVGLDREALAAIAAQHLGDVPFEVAFEEVFGQAPPDDINSEHRLTIVASELDPSSERIVQYLSGFGVPINAAFFAFFGDEGRQYLGRSWLISSDSGASSTGDASKPVRKGKWSGKDWYVSFGDGLGRSWLDGRKYNFVSAGGGVWYSRSLRNIPVGARIWVYLPQTGYVAVGTTTGPATAFDEAVVTVDGELVRLREEKLAGRLHAAYVHAGSGDGDGDAEEYVIPVEWERSLPKEQAIREKGLFANQNSACKLRQQFTIERLMARFGLTE